MRAEDSTQGTMRENGKSLESFHTLQILDEVARGRSITQRDLSKRLGIALGMTNSYLRRLARQGYIQMVQAERKRLHYFLTPRGFAEKSALTYQYIKNSYRIFKDASERLRDFFDGLAQEGAEKVVLYKASVVAEIAILVLQDVRMELVGIVDENCAGRKFLGYQVLPIEALEELEFDRLLITSEDSLNGLVQQLEAYGVVRRKICLLE